MEHKLLGATSGAVDLVYVGWDLRIFRVSNKLLSTVYPGTTFSEVLPQIFTNKDLLVGKTSRKYLLLCLNFQEMSLILYFK